MQATVQTWDSSIESTGKWYVRCMPSLTDLVFMLPLFFLFGRLSGTRLLLGDGDTGWHIRTGEWILSHRAVPTRDFFSFTRANQPWFAWEWGWDLLFGAIHKFCGLGGVAFVNAIILGIVAVLIYKLALRASASEFFSFIVTTIAICGSAGHWLARPHLMSWIFFLLFLHLIRDLQEGRKRAFYLLPAVTVLWANVHPSFFLGILLLLCVASEEAIQQFIDGRHWFSLCKKCIPYLWAIASCSLTSLLNPYSWRLDRHIFTFLNSDFLNAIQEYQSVNFHYSPAGFFECMLLLAAASVVWSLAARDMTSTICILFWAHAALFAARSIPLFLMVAAPLAAKMLSHVTAHSTIPRLRSILVPLSQISEDLHFFERRKQIHAVSAVAVLTLAGLFAAGVRGFEGQFDPGRFPVTAIPAVVASHAQRIFASDQWGGYLIYRQYPAKKVFVDGRADVFGYDLASLGPTIRNARYDWSHQLDRFAVDMVIIKPDEPLATVLKVSPSWMRLFDDGKVIVFEAKLSRMQKLDLRADRRSR